MSVANVYERQMLDLINGERQALGLDPLQLELRLNAASEDHSTWMQDTNVFSHTGIGGSSAMERMVDAGFVFSGSWAAGENLAWQSERGAPGIADDVYDLHIALMNSPGHRANILSPHFDFIGIGITEGVFNGYQGVMITQKFAATSAGVSLDQGAPAAAPVPAPAKPLNGLEYIASYSDLMAAFGPNSELGVAHFLSAGQREGRTTSFDALDYIASYGDLTSVFGANADAGATHFIVSGRNEGRSTTFNGLEYIASHDDLMAAFGLNDDAGAEHFIFNGRLEGRNTSFDALEYIASHGDLIMAFGANADAGASHYIASGRFEGRSNDSFDAQQYLDNYGDLAAAFGDNLEAATIHYIQAGFYEGRTDDFDFI